MDSKLMKIVKDYGIITVGTFLIVAGAYFFKFPNNFSFGGVTGIAVVLGKLLPYSPSSVTTVINMLLLAVGFLFLGKQFGIKTVYVTILTSIFFWLVEFIYPMKGPMTNQPVLELVFAIVLPAAGAAILFNAGASGGGTDIIAMIIKKYTSFQIGIALFIVDMLITLSVCFVFDAQTGLFSFCGLLAKTLVIDNVIESMNMCKYFNVICDHPEPICEFITQNLHRGATICKAEGAYSHDSKYVIYTALKRPQAVQLRNYVKQIEPNAFILISSTSEIIGKGFQNA